MSEYRVEQHPRAEVWYVFDGVRCVADCYTQADAERIARALRLLDQQEEHADCHLCPTCTCYGGHQP